MYGCIRLLCADPWQGNKALNVLIELKGVQQIADERRRRWFSSTDMDLIVWYDEDDSIAGFELYYDKNIREQCQRQSHPYLCYRPEDQGIFSIYCFFGGKDGFVMMYKNPKAILIDISAFTHTGVVKKTNM